MQAVPVLQAQEFLREFGVPWRGCGARLAVRKGIPKAASVLLGFVPAARKPAGALQMAELLQGAPNAHRHECRASARGGFPPATKSCLPKEVSSRDFEG